MDLEVFWPTELSSQMELNLDSIVKYQREKFDFLKNPLLQRYSECSSLRKSEYPYFSDLGVFIQSPKVKGYVLCVILEVNQKEKYKLIDVMDASGVYVLKIPKEVFSDKDYASIIPGLQLGFFLDKKQKREHHFEISLKSTLSKITEEPPLECNYFLWPDLGSFSWPQTGKSKVVVASDIHCGSITFLKENFINLIDKINLDLRVKYLVLNGDTVDGKYIFPGHDAQLNLKSYLKQYQLLATILSNLRQDVCVLIQPGNHDMVRKVEPQYFPQQIRELMFKYKKQIRFLSNPSYFSIQGVYFYLTHGTSYNSILNAVNWLDSDHCVQATEYLCKARNISPIRNAVPIRPNNHLTHLIPEKTNIVCAGHMHNQGVKIYKDRLLVNTGAWQHLTPYMKLLGVHASVAQCVCIDLKNPESYEQWNLTDSTTDTHTYHRAIVEKA